MTTTSSKRKIAQKSAIAGTVFAASVTLFVLSPTPRAQSFSSGSDGSDGALTVAANQGTIIFDPTDIARWGKVFDADGDGVYNFTTISVGAASTLRLQGDKVNRPVYWLASGNVTIDGTLDLSGSGGTQTVDPSLRRLVAVPGSGGYAGGAGGLLSPSIAPTPGDGPGGGTGGQNCVQNDPNRVCGTPGTFSGNRYGLPLVGGSGGAGGVWDSYFGGGAGGGAIAIGSSTLIAVNGTITAAGGSTPTSIFQSGGFRAGGGGSGGVIRLVAPTLSGNGHLNVTGGNVGVSGSNSGSAGLVRLESFSGGTSFVLDAGGAVVTRGSPVDPSTLRPASSIRVASIDGVPVAPNPSGSFVLPDVTISNSGSVNVTIQATGIPNGTVVTLQVFPQTPTDLTVVNLPTAQATLSGTLQSSTATVPFTFPYGFSRGFVRATWTQ